MGLIARSTPSSAQLDGPARRPVRNRRRALRRKFRTAWSELVAFRARLSSGPHPKTASGGGQTRVVDDRVVDHGYQVRTVRTDRIDQHRHQVQLQRVISDVAAEVGVHWRVGRADWRAPLLIEMGGDADLFWRALTAVDSDRLALTIHVPRPTAAGTRTVPDRLLESVLGVEFTAYSARLAEWDPPLPLEGPPPTAQDWLVASHETTRDGSRHLGLDAAIHLRFLPESAGIGFTSTERTGGSEPASGWPIDFPIDAVFTWVDFRDLLWQRQFAETERPNNLVRAAASSSRFNHVDELRYSLRSISEFAPWINHIWLVTAGQIPKWLDVGNDRITVISHQDIWAGEDGLPSFNSQAIEANLDRIPGLTEHFLYFNDDMLIGRPVQPETFFTPDGKPKVFISSSAIAGGDPVASDLAPDAAGKNNRRLVAEATGQVRSAKYQHAPYALRRSIIAQLEQRFAPELAATRRSQFRSTSDVTAAGGLHHSYALATGQAVAGDIRHRYVDLEGPQADHLLEGIARYRFYESFCVNVVLSGPRDPAGLVRFLRGYFPDPAPWEIRRDQG